MLGRLLSSVLSQYDCILCMYVCVCVMQVLLQPQFIKAESLLLTTLKPDVSMVTTVASPCITSLATSTAPVQGTSLQVALPILPNRSKQYYVAFVCQNDFLTHFLASVVYNTHFSL